MSESLNINFILVTIVLLWACCFLSHSSLAFWRHEVAALYLVKLMFVSLMNHH